jgi:hypothetical protein
MASLDDMASQIIEAYAAAWVNENLAFLTYGDLAVRIGRAGQHRLLGAALDTVRQRCLELGIPDIATVIVDKKSLHGGVAKPSEAALKKYGGWPKLRKQQAAVISFDWSTWLPSKTA